MRNTRLRKMVLEVFQHFNKPISVPELQEILSQKCCTPNKTSLYRLLKRLEKEGFVETVLLDCRTVYFEYKTHHHHHFVCNKCKTIYCVQDKALEKTVRNFERKLHRSGVEIQSHQFFFSGVCVHCAS